MKKGSEVERGRSRLARRTDQSQPPQIIVRRRPPPLPPPAVEEYAPHALPPVAAPPRRTEHERITRPNRAVLSRTAALPPRNDDDDEVQRGHGPSSAPTLVAAAPAGLRRQAAGPATPPSPFAARPLSPNGLGSTRAMPPPLPDAHRRDPLHEDVPTRRIPPVGKSLPPASHAGAASTPRLPALRPLSLPKSAGRPKPSGDDAPSWTRSPPTLYGLPATSMPRAEDSPPSSRATPAPVTFSTGNLPARGPTPLSVPPSAPPPPLGATLDAGMHARSRLETTMRAPRSPLAPPASRLSSVARVAGALALVVGAGLGMIGLWRVMASAGRDRSVAVSANAALATPSDRNERESAPRALPPAVALSAAPTVADAGATAPLVACNLTPDERRAAAEARASIEAASPASSATTGTIPTVPVRPTVHRKQHEPRVREPASLGADDKGAGAGQAP